MKQTVVPKAILEAYEDELMAANKMPAKIEAARRMFSSRLAAVKTNAWRLEHQDAVITERKAVEARVGV